MKIQVTEEDIKLAFAHKGLGMDPGETCPIAQAFLRIIPTVHSIIVEDDGYVGLHIGKYNVFIGEYNVSLRPEQEETFRVQQYIEQFDVLDIAEPAVFNFKRF